MQISKFRLAVAGVLTATTFSVLGAGTAYAYQETPTRAAIGIRQSTWCSKRSTRLIKAFSSLSSIRPVNKLARD